MKGLKRIIKWILISLVIQMLVLSYFNFIYLPNRGNVRATVYDPNGGAVNNQTVSLPQGAENVSVSYNGKYYAYMLEDEIVIKKTGKTKPVVVISAAEGSLSYFRWIPERDMLIFGETEPEGEKGEVRLSTFDVNQNLERHYPVIKDLPENSKVLNVELSPLTNVVYLMVQTGENKSKIYKFNIMDNLSSVMTSDISTVIKETMYKDMLIFQKTDGKITFRNGSSGTKNTFSLEGKYTLISVDKSDRVYVGLLNGDGLIKEIRFGSTEEKAKEWETVALKTPQTTENILVSPGGLVCINSKEDKTLNFVSGGDEIEYKGEVVALLDRYLISLEGRKLYFKVVEKSE